MAANRKSDDFYSIKTQLLTIQNPDGSFPPQASIFTAGDTYGRVVITDNIDVNSVFIASSSGTTGGLLTVADGILYVNGIQVGSTTGSIGATGSLGSTGASGSQGSIGTTGSIGPMGSQESTGSTGETGSIGTTGTIGSTGEIGVNGSLGIQGTIGVAGGQGSIGSNGPIGDIGPTGALGAVGEAPLMEGAIGSLGPTGPPLIDTNLFMIGGLDMNGNTMYSSIDGITWSTANMTNTFTSVCRAVAYNGSMWVAVGNSPTGNITTIKYSYNGYNWYNGINTNLAMGLCIAWNGSRWVAGGGKFGSATVTSMQYSDDGITWNNCSPVNLYAYDTVSVTWSGTKWAACGIDNFSGTITPRILFSLDGINWTSVNTSAGPGVGPSFNTIKFNGGLWLGGTYAFNTQPVFYSEDDGLTWSNTGSSGVSGSISISILVWDGLRWIASGSAGAGPARIYYSSDGKGWTQNSTSTLQYQLADILWTGNLLIASGDDKPPFAQYSTNNGTSWNNCIGINFVYNLFGNAPFPYGIAQTGSAGGVIIANGSTPVVVVDRTVSPSSRIVLSLFIQSGNYLNEKPGGACISSVSTGSFTVVNYHGADSSTYKYIVL